MKKPNKKKEKKLDRTPIIIQPPSIHMGWVCPLCRTAHSPSVVNCKCNGRFLN